MDQRDGYARTDQPRLPERAVACMDAGSAAVRALGPEMTQRMCSEARLCGHLVTMEICQDLNSLRINGLRFSSSCLDFLHLGGVGEDVGELSLNCGWGFSAVGFQPRQCNISAG